LSIYLNQKVKFFDRFLKKYWTNNLYIFRYVEYLGLHQGSLQPTCTAGNPNRPHPTKTVTYSLALQDFRFIVDQAGFEGKLYSEHSGKRGAATYAANAGMAEAEICEIGNWKNLKTARLYIEDNTPLRVQKHLKLQKLL